MKSIKEKGLSSAKIKYSFEPTVSESEGVPTFEDCFGACYDKYRHDETLRSMCVRGCEFFRCDASESKESAPIDTSDVLKNIEDSFYSLADSFPVL